MATWLSLYVFVCPMSPFILSTSKFRLAHPQFSDNALGGACKFLPNILSLCITVFVSYTIIIVTISFYETTLFHFLFSSFLHLVISQMLIAFVPFVLVYGLNVCVRQPSL